MVSGTQRDETAFSGQPCTTPTSNCSRRLSSSAPSGVSYSRSVAASSATGLLCASEVQFVEQLIRNPFLPAPKTQKPPHFLATSATPTGPNWSENGWQSRAGNRPTRARAPTASRHPRHGLAQTLNFLERPGSLTVEPSSGFDRVSFAILHPQQAAAITPDLHARWSDAKPRQSSTFSIVRCRLLPPSPPAKVFSLFHCKDTPPTPAVDLQLPFISPCGGSHRDKILSRLLGWNPRRSVSQELVLGSASPPCNVLPCLAVDQG